MEHGVFQGFYPRGRSELHKFCRQMSGGCTPSRRDLLPGAVFTVLGLVVLRLISVLLFTHWLNWYSTTYGAFGIVIAAFFWIILIGTVLVLAAALSPALAHRRDLRAARA